MVKRDDIMNGTELNLIGAGEPHIRPLIGGQWGTERLYRMFKAATWRFQPDGTFLFWPPPTADVRDDLFPLGGIYLTVEKGLEFQGVHQSPSGARASVEGIIHLSEATIHLEAVYAISAMNARKKAEISQVLEVQAEEEADQAEIGVAGVTTPSVFEIVLTGQTDGHPFGPLPGQLKILPPYPGDPNPVLVSLATLGEERPGSLLWSSYTPFLAGQGEQSCDITIDGDQIQVEAKPSNMIRAGLVWFTLAPATTLLADMVVGVTVKRGRLTFSVREKRVLGDIQATGVSDGGATSVYEAQIKGQRLAGLPDLPALIDLTESDETVSPSIGVGEVDFSGVAPDEKQRLRDQGYDLILQGECEQAIPVLETALDLYRADSEQEETGYLTQDAQLIDVVNILTRLAHCYSQRGDYDKLLQTLMAAVDTRRTLSQRDYLAGTFEAQADLIQRALARPLETWRARLTAEMDRITALEQAQPFFQKLVPFLVELGSGRAALVAAETSRARAFADLLAGRSRPHAVTEAGVSFADRALVFEDIVALVRDGMLEVE